MSNENTPPSPSARRASFAPGQKLTEFFGRQPPNSTASGTPAYPGPIAAAAQANQRRRMSVTTLGLSGSPNQTSPFGLRPRQNSSSSNGSGSPPDESAIDESGDAASPPGSSPFARRMSFGARAMRDVRGGTGTFNGRASHLASSQHNQSGRSLSSSPEDGEEVASPNKSNMFFRFTGEGGFNWSDQIRSRAERSSSISNGGHAGGGSAPAPPPLHHKAASVAAVEQPAKEAPKTPKAPDHFQERILKGDFYMD